MVRAGFRDDIMQQCERMHLISRITVAGALVFFEEYKGTEPHELLIIYMGIALMISAMVTIAFCKSRHILRLAT